MKKTPGKSAGTKGDWQNISIRMSPGLLRGIDAYMVDHAMRDRSELIREAVSEFIKYTPTPEDREAELRQLQESRKKKIEAS